MMIAILGKHGHNISNLYSEGGGVMIHMFGQLGNLLRQMEETIMIFRQDFSIPFHQNQFRFLHLEQKQCNWFISAQSVRLSFF